MLIELPRFAVALARANLNTFDVDVIHQWLKENLTGDVAIMNFAGGPGMTVGVKGAPPTDVTTCDAIFYFEVYTDALHFQMRFIG